MSDADPRPPAPLDAEGVEAAIMELLPYRGTLVHLPQLERIARAAITAYFARLATQSTQDATADVGRLAEIRARAEAAMRPSSRVARIADFMASGGGSLLVNEQPTVTLPVADIEWLLSLLANLPSQDAKEAVIEAARAEVLAQGYRSSDMARALQALDGEFWFENYVPPLVPSSKQVCGYAVTTEMDDGPLTQRCSRRPHGSEVEHYFGANLPSQRDDGLHRPVSEQMVDEEAEIEGPEADDVLVDVLVCEYCFHLLYPDGPDDYYHPDVFWPCPTARERASQRDDGEVGRDG